MNHTIQKIILFTGVIILQFTVLCAQTSQEKPNIILVITDQWRGQAIGIANEDKVFTPRLDELAASGVWFKNAYAARPICGPNRACILTGQYPVTNGVYGNSVRMSTASETIGTVSKANGYQTAYIGKWHLDGPDEGYVPPYRRSGFDYWIMSNHHQPFNQAYYIQDSRNAVRKPDTWEPDWITDRAIEYIHSHHNDPIMLVLSYGPPHTGGGVGFEDRWQPGKRDKNGEIKYGYGYAAPSEYENLYPDPENYPRRPNVEPVGKYEDPSWQTLPGYFGAISSIDYNLGRLVDSLKKYNKFENTILFFTSDHGEMLGSQGRMTKGIWYEEAVSVPAIVSYPGVISPGKITNVFSSIDIFPTLCGLAGMDVPKEVQGTDFSPALTGNTMNYPEYLFTSFDHGSPGANDRSWRGVNTENYTFVLAKKAKYTIADDIKEDGMVLYDKSADPYQMNPIYKGMGYDQVIDSLFTVLTEHLDRTGDPFTEEQWNTENAPFYYYDDALNRSLISAGTTWDVTKIFGVDTIDASPGTILALDSARIFFNNNPNDTLVLYYPAGEYNFMANAPTIDFGSSFSPGVKGRLVIQGAGYESTVFITKDRTEHSIYGQNVYRVLFKGIHFTRDYCTVSQGTVVSVAPGEVVLDLHEGFPTPDSLMAIGRGNSAGLWLRKYTDDIEDPHIITENNNQIAWDTSANTYQIENRRWKIGLKNSSLVAPYSPGDIIGIKLKHGGQTFWLCGGDDIHFESCKWTRKTRGVLRCGISNVSFIDCHFDRGPKVGGRTPVMASPGGGPQIGQPHDEEIHNVVVENCTFISSGDDNVAFFNVNGGIIRNIVSKDAFARGILLNQSKNICLENNVVERSPILWTGGGDGTSICDAPVTNPDTESPSIVTGLNVTDTSFNSVTIIWDPATDNAGVEGYEIYQANTYLQTTSDTFAIITGLNPGTVYAFRVLAVDSSGNKSQIAGIRVTTKEYTPSGISPGNSKIHRMTFIFPNPAHDLLRIRLAEKPLNASFKLIDLSGRLQLLHSITNNISELDISQLKKGMYIAEVSTNAKIYRKRLIIR